MIRRPPRTTRPDTPFPSTTPFRSGAPGNALAVLLDDFPLVIDQHQRVVRGFVGMFLMPLTGQRKHPPRVGRTARGGKDRRLFAWNTDRKSTRLNSSHSCASSMPSSA